MRPASAALLLGIAMVVAAGFVLGGAEWGGALLLLFGLLSLVVGLVGSTGGTDAPA